jgi:multidrug resistance efflux pump
MLIEDFFSSLFPKNTTQEVRQQDSYVPTSSEELFRKQNQFSATAEHFMNTSSGFVLKGPIYIIFMVLFAAVIYSFFAKIDTKVSATLGVSGEEYLVQSPVLGSVSSVFVSQDEEIKQQQEMITLISESILVSEENLNELNQELKMIRNKHSEINYSIEKIKQLAKYYSDKNAKFNMTLPVANFSIPDEMTGSMLTPMLADTIWQKSEYYHQVQSISVTLNQLWFDYQRSEQLRMNQEKIYTEDQKLFEKEIITEYQAASSHQQYLNLVTQTENYINNFKLEIYNNLKLLLDLKQQVGMQFREIKSKIEQTQILDDEVVIEDRVCLVKAKYPGVVAKINVKSYQYIARGMILIKIIRNDMPKTGLTYITDQNISKVKPGQAVSIKFDAYPYQNYGVQMGEVVTISPEAQLVPGIGYAYEAEIVFGELNDKMNLKYGMRGTAEIQTGSKRMIETFFAPITKVFDYINGKDSDK